MVVVQVACVVKLTNNVLNHCVLQCVYKKHGIVKLKYQEDPLVLKRKSPIQEHSTFQYLSNAIAGDSFFVFSFFSSLYISLTSIVKFDSLYLMILFNRGSFYSHTEWHYAVNSKHMDVPNT